MRWKHFIKNQSSFIYALIAVALFYLLWWMNTYLHQAFCVPVEWARILLVFSTSAFVLHFFKWIKPIELALWFLNGLFIWVCFYCAWFVIDGENWIMSLFYGFLPLIVPLCSIFILIYKSLQLSTYSARLMFYSGLIVPVIILLVNACLYMSAYHRINSGRMQHHYWEEKIVGMHFKYHTRMCLYDGWRPPMHEPMLVIFNRVFGDPLKKLSLYERIKFYKKEFPTQPIRVECTCSEIPDAKTYLKDAIFD